MTGGVPVPQALVPSDPPTGRPPMTSRAVPETDRIPRPRRGPEGPRAALRAPRLLVRGYLGLSLLALLVIVLLRHHAAQVNSAVWTRGVIVVAGAPLMIAVAARAADGSRRAYRRLRIITAVTVVAIVVIVAVPDPFPVWLKIEQGVGGMLLLAVTVLVNRRPVRAAFEISTRR